MHILYIHIHIQGVTKKIGCVCACMCARARATQIKKIKIACLLFSFFKAKKFLKYSTKNVSKIFFTLQFNFITFMLFKLKFTCYFF